MVFKKTENLESLRFVYMLYLLPTPLEEIYSTPAPSSPRPQLHFPLTLLRSVGSVIATPPRFNSCISPTAWKVSKYGVFSGPYYPLFGLNTEIYSVNLRIQSKCRKYGAEKTPYLDTFHAVVVYKTKLLLAIVEDHLYLMS